MSLFFDRIRRFLGLLIALSIRPFIKVKKGRVFCWAYSFKMYGCNPMYITKYILENYSDVFDVIWALNDSADRSVVDDRVTIVKPGTFNFLKYIYSSQFIITNSRNDFFGYYFLKKKNQIYIQAWHGSVPLKKIEKDAADVLGPVYVRRAKLDSKMCDLIISDSSFFSNLVRTSFWYNGEIFEKGVPRNDIFFNKEYQRTAKQRIISNYKLLSDKAKIVLYAPTFRAVDSADNYSVNWNIVLNKLEEKFECPVCLFLRLHPNSVYIVDINKLLTDSRIVNMCYYHDMQELLSISDILITDYSSTMFDFALMDKVCFLYAKDINEYNRGFYFDLHKLPFPLANNEAMLIDNILKFNKDKYLSEINLFKTKVLGIHNDGSASMSIVKWMLDKM